MLNQFNSVTQAEYKECPARLSQHILRTGRAGLGWKNAAVAKQKLQLASDWMSRGWNVGNLQQSVHNDTINGLLAQGWHICCIQEAFIQIVHHQLYDARGLQSQASRDHTIRINSGVFGLNLIYKTHV